MYDIKNFGERLQTLRKAKSMTQEDLAHRVGVTGQAVSKWETNQSYPDITLLPAVAEILETTISHLFGEQPTSHIQEEVEYPAEYQGLKLVLSSPQGACYSNKSVKSTDNTGVIFEDGSTAELTTRIVTNRGQGEITILGPVDEKLQSAINQTKREKKEKPEPIQHTFGYCRNIIAKIPNCDCKIMQAPGEETLVFALGDLDFLECLKVEYSGDDSQLTISHNMRNYMSDSSHKNNLTIMLPLKEDESGGNLTLVNGGAGDIICELPQFETGEIILSGTGDVSVHHFSQSCSIAIRGTGDVGVDSCNTAKINISGTGDLSMGSCQNAEINISGTGGIALGSCDKAQINVSGTGDVVIGGARDVSAIINGSSDLTIGGFVLEDGKELGNFAAKIGGSSDIKIGDGNCNKFDIDIMGSADVNAKNVTANTSHIVIHTEGKVHLGRVIKSSTEQIKQIGEIKIDHRG